MSEAVAKDPSSASRPVVTTTLLQEIGFEPAMTDGGAGYALVLGPLQLSALECIGPEFVERVLLSGNYATSRTIGTVNHLLPIDFETREEGLAFLAHALRSFKLGEHEPAWLVAGRDYAHLLPGERERAAYDAEYAARPNCTVSREWLRLALRTFAERAGAADAATPIRFLFDGALLTIRREQVVVSMPASGRRWETGYEISPDVPLAPPSRFMQPEVDISVFRGDLTIGPLRFCGAVPCSSGHPTGSAHE
jgi:hypothetical protein